MLFSDRGEAIQVRAVLEVICVEWSSQGARAYSRWC